LGVIKIFKAFYLHRIFKQLAEKTDGEDKQSISQFWTNYNIMSAIDNTRTAWNEVTANCCSEDWRKVWPEACSNLGRKLRRK
jgi:hypothetical protein